MPHKLLQNDNNPHRTEARALLKRAESTGDKLAWRLALLAVKMARYRDRMARKASKTEGFTPGTGGRRDASAT